MASSFVNTGRIATQSPAPQFSSEQAKLLRGKKWTVEKIGPSTVTRTNANKMLYISSVGK